MTTDETLDRQLRVVRQIAAHRPAGPNYAAYERFKAEFEADHPDAAPETYTRAMQVFAAACGV